MSLTVVYILVAILLFGLLVLVHEFGHFLTAKLSGVQVNEFSLFMGPAIWKKQKGETLYSLRCIPIGGYCAMEGEDGDSDNPRAFGRAKVWKRLIILVAGSFMNLVAGLLIMTIYVASVYQAIPTRAVASVDSASVFAGQLQAGDFRMMHLLANLKTDYFPVTAAQMQNANTPEIWSEIQKTTMLDASPPFAL